jgi:RNA-binding protein YlmH
MKLINYWRTETFYNRGKVFKLALVVTQYNENVSTGSMISSRGYGRIS